MRLAKGEILHHCNVLFDLPIDMAGPCLTIDAISFSDRTFLFLPKAPDIMARFWAVGTAFPFIVQMTKIQIVTGKATTNEEFKS